MTGRRERAGQRSAVDTKEKGQNAEKKGERKTATLRGPGY